MHLLATNVVLDPIVAFLTSVLHALTGLTHNFGWSLVLLAVLVKLVFWPLNSFQFKSIAKMQALQPQLKALQAKYKGDPQRLQQEQMALYKATGVNPFASCLPLLLQLPILWSMYWAITHSCSDFTQSAWGWIGSAIAEHTPIVGQVKDMCAAPHTTTMLPVHLIGTSLLLPDYLLLALYVISMYFSVRFSSPAMDPQQAQQQKIMAFISPVMIAFIGRSWPSALILYWLTFNVLTMGQQMYLMRRFAAAPAGAGAVAVTAAAGRDARSEPNGGAVASTAGASSPNGTSRRQRRKKGSRR